MVPWSLANTGKFMTKIDVKVVVHHVVDPANHRGIHRVSHLGELAVSEQRRKCLRLGATANYGRSITHRDIYFAIGQ